MSGNENAIDFGKGGDDKEGVRKTLPPGFAQKIEGYAQAMGISQPDMFRFLATLLPDDVSKLQKALEMAQAVQMTDQGPSPTGGPAADMRETMQTMLYAQVIKNLSGGEKNDGNMDAIFNKLIIMNMMENMRPKPEKPSIMEQIMQMREMQAMNPQDRLKVEEIQKQREDEYKKEREAADKIWNDRFAEIKASIDKKEHEEELTRIRNEGDQRFKDFVQVAKEMFDQKMEQVLQRYHATGGDGRPASTSDKLEIIKQGMKEYEQLRSAIVNSAGQFLPPDQAQAAANAAAKKSGPVGEFMDQMKEIVGSVEKITTQVSKATHPGTEVPPPDGRVVNITEKVLRPVEFDTSKLQFQPQ